VTWPTKFSPLQRRAIGLLALTSDVAMTLLAREYQCSTSTVFACAKEAAQSFPGWTPKGCIESHAAGSIQGLRRYFRDLQRIYLRSQLPFDEASVPGAMRLRHCTAHFRYWGDVPELLFEHGCDSGAAFVRGLHELDGLADRLDSFRNRARHLGAN